MVNIKYTPGTNGGIIYFLDRRRQFIFESH